MKKKRTLAFPYRQRSVLHIDIASESFEVIPLSESDAKAYLGGRLLALELWKRFAVFTELGAKYYESGNPIVFAPGAASDLSMPCPTSYTMVTKSPITGRIAVGSAASSLAGAIAGSGYSALVITGRARRLLGFSIHDGGVSFTAAEELHNMTTVEVARRVGSKHVVSIGPAGEHLVAHASLVADNQNIRCGGIAMVFGLKNIKYFSLDMSSTGRESYDPHRFGLLVQSSLQAMSKSRIRRPVAKEGTLARLAKANHHGWAAIDNYSMRIDGRLWGLCPRSSEEEVRKEDVSCPVCEEKSAMDLQSAMALGSNLELFDSRSVQQLVARCLENGLDPISAGAVLSWARKSRMDGLLGFLPDMQRSSAMLYLRLLDAMAYQRGTGEQLGKTMEELVATYGGADHAFEVDNLPLPPFDYRALPVQALLASLGDERMVYGELLWGNRYRRGNERTLASWALYVQQLSSALESVGLCPLVLLPSFAHPLLHFPRWKNKHKNFTMLASFASLGEGYEISAQQMMEFGKKAEALQQQINDKLLEKRKGRLPDQLLVNGKSNYQRAQVVPLARLLDAYQHLSRYKK
jgi:aldehyde:ferredoxin oxidoreductase